MASRLLAVLVIIAAGAGVPSAAKRAVATETPGERSVWLVAARPELAGPIARLAEHRRAQGLEPVVSTEPVEKALAAVGRKPDFLLLVGDDEPGRQDQPWFLPAKRRELYRWREAQRKEFASDALWGDLDGDLVPDVAVGRIPARTAAEVDRVVEKVLAFEKREPDLRDLQLAIWAGSPGYGGAIDRLATGLLSTAVETGAPAWAEPWIISADPAHPLCGWPPDQPRLFTERMRQGSLVSVLMGHGAADRFFSMKHRGEWIAYAAADAKEQLASGPPAAPLVVFACDCGAFADASPCLAESLLLLPGGPVAAIAATTESHPLTNYYSGKGLLAELRAREPRVGLVWLAAQRRAIKMRDLLVEPLLRDVEGKLEARIDVAKLRRDQVLMYALLGDPATRLRLPQPLKATIERTESGWRWTAERPLPEARLHVAFRPKPSLSLPAGPRARDPETLLADFEKSNAAMAFTPLAGPAPGGPWEGAVDRPGRVRLVATGPGVFCAAVLKAE